MTAADILRMIEAVSPDDAVKLDDIDARVWCYTHEGSVNYIGYERPQNSYILVKYKWPESQQDLAQQVWNSYTRSRDALKGIMPSCEYSYRIDGGTRSGFYNCKFSLCNFETTVISLPTEELAVLHAIIQAIEHERGGK